MLLSASIRIASRLEYLRPGDRLLDHLAIGAEPVAVGHELAALDGEDPDPAAALVVIRGDFERREEAAERKVLDLLSPLLYVVTGRLLAAVQLQRLADRLDLHRRLQQPAIVDDGVFHLLWRLFSLLLVHRLDFLAYRVIVAGAGELHRAIAFGDGPAASRLDVVLGRGPHQTHHLR